MQRFQLLCDICQYPLYVISSEELVSYKMCFVKTFQAIYTGPIHMMWQLLKILLLFTYICRTLHYWFLQKL